MLDLYTIVWGDMAELYCEACLPSLLHPSNIPYIAGHGGLYYTFYASDEARETIKAHALYGELERLVHVDWQPVIEYDCNDCFRRQMIISDMRRNHMLCIGPEEIYGASSLRHIADLAASILPELSHRDSNPILFGYPRVTKECWDRARLKATVMHNNTLTNSQLVSLAMEGRTDIGNYKVWKVHKDVWLVYYNIPTICLLPDNRIIDFFSTNSTRLWGFDHILPMAMVEWGYPWHMITDSDQFFMMHLGTHTIAEEGKGETEPSWAKMITHASLNPTTPSRIEDIGWRGIKFFGAMPEVWHR